MKKIGIIIVIGILGIGLVQAGLKQIHPDDKIQPVQVTTVSPEKAVNQSAISEIFQKAKDSSCEVLSYTTGSRTQMYINGKNIRVMTQSKDGQDGQIISDGDWFYIWTSQNKGIKISTGSATDSAQKLVQSFTALDAKSIVNCVDWEVDKSQFELPKEVVFTDLTKQISNFKPTGNL